MSIFLLNKCLVYCRCIGKQSLGEVLGELIEIFIGSASGGNMSNNISCLNSLRWILS